MLRSLFFAFAALMLVACDGGSSSTDGGSDCPAPSCGLMCSDGLKRDADGCEICECNPTPDTRCSVDDDCVLAVDHADCCGCRSAYAATSIEGHACIRPVTEPPPPGCAPDSCTGEACRCSYPIRAACQSGACVALDDCPAGQVQELGACVAGCASHADCTIAADYGSCCGGCTPLTRATVDANPCYAERSSDSECSPGSCEGLGCASPALDCSTIGTAVCMADGTCQLGGASGECPAGSMEMGGVCVPTP